MEVHLVTGTIDRDYVELVAETLAECSMLVLCGQSAFVPHDTFFLSPGYSAGKATVMLRIYITPAQGLLAHLPTGKEIDSTP